MVRPCGPHMSNSVPWLSPLILRHPSRHRVVDGSIGGVIALGGGGATTPGAGDRSVVGAVGVAGHFVLRFCIMASVWEHHYCALPEIGVP